MQWLDPDFIFQTVLPALNRGLVMSIALIVPSATIGFVLGVLTGVGHPEQELHGHRLAQLHVAREPDLAHRPGAEQTFELVLSANEGADVDGHEGIAIAPEPTAP